MGVDTELVIDQNAEMEMSLGNVRQDTLVGVPSRLTIKNSAGKEFVVKAKPFLEIDAAYDGLGDRCPLTFINSDAALADAYAAGTCLDIAVHTGKIHPTVAAIPIFRKNGRLPYNGTLSLDDIVNGPKLFDIGALVGVPDVLKLDLDFHTFFTATTTGGYQALRELRNNSSVLDSTTLRWLSDGQLIDTLNMPCGAPLGANLTYRLANQRWTGNVTVTTNPRLDISLAGINLFGFDLNGATLISGPITVSGDNIAHLLGVVLPEQQKPTVTGGGPYTGSEGATVALTATGIGLNGSFDNCDPTGNNLTYTWSFGDGLATQVGRTVNKLFIDNGTFNGTLAVTDAAGNVRTVPVVAQIANVTPTATFTADTVSGGRTGLTTTLALTSPSDVSVPDRNAGFTYAFDCGNGYGPFSGASSRVCSGTVAGATVKGKIRDKDGGVTEYTGTVTPSTTVLTVVTDGDAVTSEPAGINCTTGPSDCTESYPSGTVVTLTANATGGLQFSAWSDNCTVNPEQPNVCVVTINAATTVTAHYIAL